MSASLDIRRVVRLNGLAFTSSLLSWIDTAQAALFVGVKLPSASGDTKNFLVK
jgi:hypothetical protein